MAKAYKLPAIKKERESRPNKVKEGQAVYQSTEQAKVIQFMGIGDRKTSFHADETFFISLIRKGLPKKVMDQLITKMGISEDDMASILHVSKRTLQRRSNEAPLNEEQSERLIELARLYSKGEGIMGDLDSFKEWMNTRLLSLGNKRPKEFLDTSIGISILLDELGRIEHGVFS
jgi:putative toxin-antitoxin system antitoxin component (TIGR02293 family)